MTTSRLELAGRSVGVWGLGREGASVAKAAINEGAAQLLMIDEATDGKVELPEDFRDLSVFRGGEHLNHLRRCDVVFVSPGVPWRHPFFDELRRSNTRITNAADWFMHRHRSRTIGVTGTKGKSTTAAFIAHLLNESGVHSVAAGNIGIPLPDLTPADGDVVVAELSSQQCALLTASPAVAVITNLYADHLDWHGDTTAYHLAKANIFRHGSRSLVITEDVMKVLEAIQVDGLPASLSVLDDETIQDEVHAIAAASDTHEHNALNFCLAARAVSEFLERPLKRDAVEHAARTFKPLPHRLQLVRTTGSLRWIDDTLSTTGDSVVAALQAMHPNAHIALIVGGLDRQLNYEQIDLFLLSGQRRVSLIQCPTNGLAIGRDYRQAQPENTYQVDGLREAVRTAGSIPGVDVVLLSPGAASYDLYTNFEAKSHAFCDYIDEWSQQE